MLFLLGRLALGLIFIYSSLSKMLNPFAFLSNLYSYEIVGETAGLIAAALLPALELVLGVFLLTGFMLEGASLISLGLLAFFCIAQTIAIIKGLKIGCGCFGSDEEMIGFWSLFRTLVMTAFALIFTFLLSRHTPKSLLRIGL
ncbi:MAG: MauE/DoxX family redox-associated membrane protein [Candidatus Sumerlaeota bacterium]